MVKNGIFGSIIKSCSANYAPSGAKYRAKLSVKFCVKDALQLSNTARICCPDKARDWTTSLEAKIKILPVSPVYNLL